MSFDPHAVGRVLHRVPAPVLSVLGPTVELLTRAADDPSVPGLLRGTIPPGVVVPLHAHEEPETFVVLSGRLEALAVHGDDPRWVSIAADGVFHVPPRARHALRGVGEAPAVALIVTRPSMVAFFERVGTPVEEVEPGAPPSPVVLERMLAAVVERGDWSASPAENAAVGIDVGPEGG